MLKLNCNIYFPRMLCASINNSNPDLSYYIFRAITPSPLNDKHFFLCYFIIILISLSLSHTLEHFSFNVRRKYLFSARNLDRIKPKVLEYLTFSLVRLPMRPDLVRILCFHPDFLSRNNIFLSYLVQIHAITIGWSQTKTKSYALL